VLYVIRRMRLDRAKPIIAYEALPLGCPEVVLRGRRPRLKNCNMVRGLNRRCEPPYPRGGGLEPTCGARQESPTSLRKPRLVDGRRSLPINTSGG
jgi:hypothetical protein